MKRKTTLVMLTLAAICLSATSSMASPIGLSANIRTAINSMIRSASLLTIDSNYSPGNYTSSAQPTNPDHCYFEIHSGGDSDWTVTTNIYGGSVTSSRLFTACGKETDFNAFHTWVANPPNGIIEEWEKGMKITSASITATTHTPYSYMPGMNGQWLEAGATGVLEQNSHKLKFKVWVKNDSLPNGYHRIISYDLMTYQKYSARVNMPAANKYPDIPQHGAYNPIAWCTPNSPTNIRDTLFCIAEGSDWDSTSFMVNTGSWQQSSSSNPVSIYNLSPADSDYHHTVIDADRPDNYSTKGYVTLIKCSDGWYRMTTENPFILVTLNHDRMEVRAETRTNLGTSGPYPDHGYATATAQRELRLVGFNCGS